MDQAERCALDVLRRDFPDWEIDLAPEIAFTAISRPHQNAEHFLHAPTVAELRVKLEAARQ